VTGKQQGTEHDPDNHAWNRGQANQGLPWRCDRGAILGANIFKDIFASIRDIVGGRSAAYEAELQKARTIAFEEMSQKALDMGANAIVGIDIDYETVGAQGGMLMVTVSGTAVTVK
jgi:uncharacterized protein YbjQ (UPF0145 family)